MEYDSFATFREHLGSYLENDEEIPMFSDSVNLFAALAGGLFPSYSYPSLDRILYALERMREEGIPRTWELKVGRALLEPKAVLDGWSFFGGDDYRRVVARMIAIARFDTAQEWEEFWTSTSLGDEMLAEITLMADSSVTASLDDVARRFAANVAALENMRADGVDLARLGSQYGEDRGTYVPLLHSSVSRMNMEMANWLLEAGMDPYLKVEHPDAPVNSGVQMDAFDVAREFDSPVLHLLQAFQAKKSMKSLTTRGR